MKTKDFLKIVPLSIVAAYFVYYALHTNKANLLHKMDFFVHEAGHVVFRPFGTVMTAVGGSLLQILMPTAFVIYFFRNRMPFSGVLIMFWLGQNFIDVSVYIQDAIEMKLPSPFVGIHDWNFILTRFDLLHKTYFFSSLVYGAGFAVFVIAVVLGIYFVLRGDKDFVSGFSN